MKVSVQQRARFFVFILMLTLGYNSIECASAGDNDITDILGQLSDAVTVGGSQLTAATNQFNIQVTGKPASINLGTLFGKSSNPFEGLLASFFKHVTIQTPSLSVNMGSDMLPESVTITMTAQVFKFNTKATLTLTRQRQIIFAAMPDTAFTLDTIAPFFKNTKVADIQFLAAFVLTNQDGATYTDDDNKTFTLQSYKEGLNIVGGIRLTGDTAKAAQVSNNAEVVTAQAFISIDTEFRGSYVKATMGKPINLGPSIQTQVPALYVGVDSGVGGVPMLKIGFEFDLAIAIPHVAKPLSFSVIMALTMQRAQIQGYMQSQGVLPQLFAMIGANGRWGFLKDIDVKNVAMEVDADYVALADGVPFDAVALSGDITFGSKELTIAIDVDFGKDQVAAVGNFTGGLKLSDLVALFGQITNTHPNVTKVPDIGIDKAYVYFVPMAMTFLGKTYDQGIKLDGVATLFGKNLSLDVDVNSQQIDGSLSIDQFNAGNVLTISGSGGKGPLTGSLQLSEAQQSLLFSGHMNLNIPGITNVISADANINVGPTHADVAITRSMLGLVSTSFNVSLDITNPAAGKLGAQFNQSALAAFANITHQAAQAIQQSSQKTLGNATAQLNQQVADLKAKETALGNMGQAINAMNNNYNNCGTQLRDAFQGK